MASTLHSDAARHSDTAQLIRFDYLHFQHFECLGACESHADQALLAGVAS